MFSIFRPERLVSETSLSRFIRDASSGEKKRIYARVIAKATADQKRVLLAASVRRESTHCDEPQEMRAS